MELGDRGAAGDGRGSNRGHGAMFGPYRLETLLGRGGMGEVWQAYDTRRLRTVALKLLSSGWADVEAFRQRFVLEAQATAQLESEHVVVIHDYGEIDRWLFIDMRLVTGGDLARLLLDTPGGLDPALAVDLCGQIADGLDAAHRQGVIHRDVKPSNVLLAADVGRYRAYLVDFGIAKLADELTGDGLTATGTTLGTPTYMAPELFEPSGSVSAASDVYALGCVLFEMLTGRRVFLGSTSSALMNQHLNHAPPAPSSVRTELAPFDPVLALALSKQPGTRQPTAEALARDAAAALPSVSPGDRDPRAGRTIPATVVADMTVARRRWRPRWAVLAAILTVVVVVVAAATIVRSTTTAPRSAVAGPAQQLAVSTQIPAGIAFSPDGRHAYIADGPTRAVQVVDTTTGATAATISLAGTAIPYQVSLSPDGSRAYVTDFGTPQVPGRKVVVIDTTTNLVTSTIPVGIHPYEVAVSPDGRRAYVTQVAPDLTSGHTVSVIDTAANTVVATIPVGDAPSRPDVSPDGKHVYVPNLGFTSSAGHTLTIIDTATDTADTVPAGGLGPAAALVSPDGGRVYIVCAGGDDTPGTVQVLDTATRTLTRLGVGFPLQAPSAAALSPDGRTLVVLEYGSSTTPGTTAAIIDTTTGHGQRVTVSGRPTATAITPDGRAAWVTTTRPAGLWRIPLTTA